MDIAVCGFAHPFGEGLHYGAERIIYYLVRELKAMGHRPVVFAINGCNLPDIEYVSFMKPWDDNIDIYWEAIKKFEYEVLGKPFDMIHSFQQAGAISDEMRERPYCLEPFALCHRFRENIVTYSHKHRQANGYPSTVVHFGLPIEDYDKYNLESGRYLTWIGRMDPGKAPDIAIDVALRAGEKLVLMGPAYNYPYFVDRIWPNVDDAQIIWIRSVDDQTKIRILLNSKCNLAPLWADYHEMFGIVNIEALACGTPIIGWGHSGVPSAINYNGGEIIEQGKQGFIIEHSDYGDVERESSIDVAVAAIGNLHSIDRMECRKLFEDKFTSQIMTKKFLRYYELVRERGKVIDVTEEL